MGHRGFARDAIEHVEEAGLAGVSDRVHAPAVVPHGHELRRGDVVEVPQVVMHRLEVPEPLAGARVEREEAVGEEILADAIRAVEVVVRRSGRDVDDAAFFVDRHRAPVVHAADVLVGLLRPRVVAELAGQRHRVELPLLLTRDDVVRADVARRVHEGFAGRRSQNHQVLPDLAGTVRLNSSRVLLGARQPVPQIDDAVLAEGQDRLAGSRIDLLKETVDRKQQPSVFPVVALPVVHATAVNTGQPLMDPDLSAGRRIQRDQRIAAPQCIHHVVDDNGIEPRGGIGIEPRDLEVADIRFLYLIGADEVRAVRPGQVIPPPPVAAGCHRNGDGDDSDKCRCDDSAPAFSGHGHTSMNADWTIARKSRPNAGDYAPAS